MYIVIYAEYCRAAGPFGSPETARYWAEQNMTEGKTYAILPLFDLIEAETRLD